MFDIAWMALGRVGALDSSPTGTCLQATKLCLPLVFPSPAIGSLRVPQALFCMRTGEVGCVRLAGWQLFQTFSLALAKWNSASVRLCVLFELATKQAATAVRNEVELRKAAGGIHVPTCRH